MKFKIPDPTLVYFVGKTTEIACITYSASSEYTAPYAKLFGWATLGSNVPESFWKVEELAPFDIPKPELSNNDVESILIWQDSKEMREWDKKWKEWRAKYDKIRSKAIVPLEKNTPVYDIYIYGQRVCYTIMYNNKEYKLCSFYYDFEKIVFQKITYNAI